MEAIEADELGRLFDTHAPALVLYARRRSSQAEDLVQEAFIKLASQRSRPLDVVSWLHCVVRNAAMNEARSARNRRKHEQRSAQDEKWLSTNDDRMDGSLMVESLKQLDLETHEIIVARIWGGLTFEQIAQLQSLSLATVYRRYRDGLHTIKKMTKQREMKDGGI